MMALHIDRGKEGEMLACAYLTKKEYQVEICNWRSGYYEIDIIATKDGVVHFIEVKTRHSIQFGYPEESISRKKFDNMKKAAACFLSRYPACLKIQFDVLSVLRLKDKPVEYFFIEDFYI
jgi:putative endonuclease